jgi:purine catabolism regulator
MEQSFAPLTQEPYSLILAEQYMLIERSDVIHRRLTAAAAEATSLQDLIDTLGRLLDRAVTFEDAEGRLLAAYSNDTPDDPVRRLTLEQGHTPEAYNELLERRGFLHQIRSTLVPLRIPAFSEHQIAARVVCPVRIRQALVGTVWVLEGASPLSELDLRAAAHAAIVAALFIAHQQALASLEARLGYTFLDSLLEGRFTPSAQALERARVLGFDVAGVYRVGMLVLDASEPLSRENFLRREQLVDRLRRTLRDLGAPSLVSLTHNQIPFLLPACYAPEALWNDLADAGWACVVGRPYPGPAGIRQGYQEVVSLLSHLTCGALYRYEDLLLPRLLTGDLLARQAFLHELLGPLETSRNGALLRESLLTWARAGFRLKQAAHTLCVHPKTLSYRLDRAAEIGGLDLEDPDLRFRLQLAAQLLALLEKPAPTNALPRQVGDEPGPLGAAQRG